MLIEKLEPIRDTLIENNIKFSETFPNEDGKNTRLVFSTVSESMEGRRNNINIFYDENINRYTYIANVDNMMFPEVFIDEISKMVTSINNVIPYGKITMIKNTLGIFLTYICHSPRDFISEEEFMENIEYCHNMVEAYFPEVSQYAQDIL